MQNTIYQLRSGNNTKSFLYTDSDIYFARYTQKDIVKFTADATYESGLSKLIRKISFFSIRKIAHVDEDATLKIWYEQNTRTQSVSFEFKSEAMMQAIAGDLANRINFRRKQKRLSVLRSVATPLLLLGCLVLLTWNAYEDALRMQHGERVHVAGHGKGQILSLLVFLLAKEFGTTGVLLLGGVFSLLTAYFLVTRFRDPPYETVFEKY